MGRCLTELLWPVARASECLGALTHSTAVPEGTGVESPERFQTWIDMAAQHAECEAEQLEIPLHGLDRSLPELQDLIIRLPQGLLAITRSRRGRLRVIAPDGAKRTISTAVVCEAIRRSVDNAGYERMEQLVTGAGVRKSHAKRAAAALFKEQLGDKRFSEAWALRVSPGSNVRRLIDETELMPNAVLLIVANTGYYLLWLASWAIMGRLSFEGRTDPAWLLAWALLLATLIPFQLFTTWAQGRIAIEFGGLLKRRLLYGAMKLFPEEIRGDGIGSFLGQALEAEAVESLALSGGIAGVLATIEIAVAACVLGRYSLLLGLWCVATVLLTRSFLKRYQSWTGTRLQMTNDLVECMVGHRTRLAQQKREDWHVEEDQAHERYIGQSRRLDRIGALLVGAVPRGWLLVGLASLAPAVVSGKTPSTDLAVTLGGILLAYTAFKRMSASYLNIALAWVAWKRIWPLFTAAGRRECLGDSAVTRGADCSQSEVVLEAERLTFRHRREGNPTLKECSLTIKRGDRILLEGPSGGGKTTFASVLCGMRRPESGLLLAGGLDMPTLGWEGWREHVAAAPQFHENHIFTGTLAFNLLMGTRWPPRAVDMQDAEKICSDLGLGDLLQRMPSGLLQMVGEGGWQLSHGERSRIFVARALLGKAQVVILDESFAALDPENLRTALECTLERAETVLVIAHP